jgi:hypothetical protein
MEQQPPPTADPTAAEVLVRDPLAPVTRKERLYLLAVSMIGIAMVKTGLVPRKIATFGIDLDPPNRSALLFLLALITIYFFVAFLIYAASDYVARREALRAVYGRSRIRSLYQDLARELSTSQGNVKALHARGALREYASQYDLPGKGELWTSYIEQLIRQLEQAEVVAERGIRNQENPNLRGHRTDVVFRVWDYFRRLYKNPDVYGTAAIRVFFEFLLPLLVGGYAIYSLLARSLT